MRYPGAMSALALLAALPGCRSSGSPRTDAGDGALLLTTTGHCAAMRAMPKPDASFEIDVDGDGTAEAVALFLSRSGRHGFLNVERGDEVWTSGVYPAWKAVPATLDAEPGTEILLGIRSRTPRHAEPEPHRTVWVLGWRDGGLVERWRGSALGRPLREFAAGDVDGDGIDELLALETAGETCAIVAYRWDGFGFVEAAQRGASCDGLGPCPENAAGCVHVDGRAMRPILRERTLELEEVR